MALTLIESAKIALGRDEVLKATVMELYAKNSDVLQYMPFENIAGNALAFNREKTLPDIGFRAVNEAYDEGTGEVENVTETLAIAGGDVDVDKFLVDTGGEGQRATQESLKIKALSLSITKEVLKGDVTSTPKGFDGLQVRCTGDQVVANSSAASGAALSLVKLDELIDAVDEPTHLIMNKALRRRLTAAARTSTVGGYITYDIDAFGRRVTKFNDLPILIADKDNTNTDILPFEEAAASGSSVCSSIYCVSFAENGVMGLQNQEMQVRDLGELETQPAYRTRVEWYITLAILRPRAAARLRNIQNATAIA
ncbi:MAG: hypothetical protein PHG66_05835 [Candidatus Colwellbacteria bacterium]|nr:hypothetical protein [Candidatus Colwellbacteria bacterium]